MHKKKIFLFLISVLILEYLILYLLKDVSIDAMNTYLNFTTLHYNAGLTILLYLLGLHFISIFKINNLIILRYNKYSMWLKDFQRKSVILAISMVLITNIIIFIYLFKNNVVEADKFNVLVSIINQILGLILVGEFYILLTKKIKSVNAIIIIFICITLPFHIKNIGLIEFKYSILDLININLLAESSQKMMITNINIILILIFAFFIKRIYENRVL